MGGNYIMGNLSIKQILRRREEYAYVINIITEEYYRCQDEQEVGATIHQLLDEGISSSRLLVFKQGTVEHIQYSGNNPTPTGVHIK